MKRVVRWAACGLALGLGSAPAQTAAPEKPDTDAPAAAVPGSAPAFPAAAIPWIDLSGDTPRQSVVDRDPAQYIGHPTTVLMEDGHTIFAVYPLGHGHGPIQLKRSDDGGKTWSARLPVPASWATSAEGPMIYRVPKPDGKSRLLVFSGRQVAANDTKHSGARVRLSVSEDEGTTWSELAPIGNYGGVAAMASMLRLADGTCLAFFHDDAVYWDRPDLAPKQQFRLFEVASGDGGLTWGKPQVIPTPEAMLLCEPGAVLSPDGGQIAVLLRENSRKFPSQVVFSNDQGKTWTPPRPLPPGLMGDRHVARYAPDGRLVVSFRDTNPASPTYGDWVAWVGTYPNLVDGKDGQYRVRLMKNTEGVDCGYPGVEVLPDGTFAATSYGHWTAKQPPYVVTVRFTLPELDAKRPPAAP